MNDRNETRADIVAEMRSRGREITGLLVPDDGGRMRAMTPELADRIEAAGKRDGELLKANIARVRELEGLLGEAVDIELRCAIIDGRRVPVLHGRVAKTPDGRIHEVFGVDFASAGTQFVMHKGVYECQGNGNAAKLREALEYARDIMPSLYDTYYSPEDGYNVQVGELDKKVNAALAAPPRNCDAGTADGQVERFKLFCDAHPTCAGCPCGSHPTPSCGAKWAQLPYDAPQEGGDHADA